MNQQIQTENPAIGASAARELLALTDEQILDIDPASLQSPSAAQTGAPGTATNADNIASPVAQGGASPVRAPSAFAEHSTSTRENASSEPPAWLARQMNDPWSGEQARDLWNGLQTARQEAAAFREVFAQPEQARAAAERARALEEIDTAFFGGAGKSAQEISSGREALAQRMLREDPAAFREMVFAGLRALESAGQNSSGAASREHVAAVIRPRAVSAQPTETPIDTKTPPSEARFERPDPVGEGGHKVDSPAVAAYRTFEQSANEELERSVGGAIQHSLKQALPNLSQMDRSASGAQGTSLRTRLQQAVRDDVESALKSDQQLGEQIGRVLATRRFDETTRSQVVRLINDRAQQLVPVAARRVIQDWTQTAFVTRRDTGVIAVPSLPAQAGISPASGIDARRASSRSVAPTTSAKAVAADRAERDAGLTSRAARAGRGVDYRLTDEQILDL